MLSALTLEWGIVFPQRRHGHIGRRTLDDPLNLIENLVQQNWTPAPFGQQLLAMFGRHIEHIVWFTKTKSCQLSCALSANMTNVDELEQVSLAAMADTLLEDADLLNEVAHNWEMVFSEDVVGQQHLLRTGQKPTHQIDTMMDITRKDIEVLLELP